MRTVRTHHAKAVSAVRGDQFARLLATGGFMAPVMIESPRSLNDFLGREIAVTDWFKVTQHLIEQFAEATGDRQWIHVDRERAQRESPHGTTIAHGFLTLSLLSYFIKQAIQIRGGVRISVNYGLNRVRFPSPVRSDSRIRARVSLYSVKQLPDATEATYVISVEGPDSEKPYCVAEWIIRYYA
jgi:acyl dehydratase